ncbi:nucleotide-diphospho-sugar transferase [Chytriomyces sp. MP71]|nr:nucleotide-diphospho-sugar transferase [Chytriomyces sp. MP71]
MGKRVAALFLAAGYGSRLQRDIDADTSGNFAHLKGIAKALLPLAGTPLISHWITILNASTAADVVPFVICNESNYPQFKQWAATAGAAGGFIPEHIFNDGSINNDGRLGAVTDLALAIKKFHLADIDASSHQPKFAAVLVIAGDTLFLRDFGLDSFLKLATLSSGAVSERLSELQEQPPCFVASYRVAHDMDTLKTGIIETSPTDIISTAASTGYTASTDIPRVTSLVEKPHPAETASRLACPCFYYLSHSSLNLVQKFVDDSLTRGEGMEARDASGRFIAALVKQYPVYAVPVSGRLDIGGLASFIEAEDYFRN